MQTDKSEIVKIIAAIKAQCPEAFSYKTKEEFNTIAEMWYSAFGNYPKAIVWAAVTNALKKTVFQKQNWLGAVNLEIEALKETTGKTDGELWAEICAAVRQTQKYINHPANDYIYFNGDYVIPNEEIVKIFEGLPIILKEFLGNAEGLKDLARQDTLEYEKGRFLRAVEVLKKREKQRQEMSHDLAKLIQGVTGRIGNENQKLLNS